MKIFFKFFAMFMILISANAYGEFTCKFRKTKGFGQVLLIKGMKIKGKTYPFSHYIGNEDWDKPYQFRKLCQRIARTLNAAGKVPYKEGWVFSHCRSYSDVEERVFLFRYKGKTFKFKSLLPFPPAEKHRIGQTSRCDSDY